MKQSLKRHIERELEQIAKPSCAVGGVSGLQAKRRHLEGFGYAIMLYGDMDEAAFMQLRRDAYVAFARGTSHALMHWSLERDETKASEEVELFGSIEAADRAFHHK